MTRGHSAMRRTIRRMATVTGATGCALLMTAGGAFAHECYIANRSDQGSMNAGNSQVWFAVDVVADLHP